ncbi:MAG: cupin-like domain-containing protein [Pseudomonadota bacterium]
MSEDFLSFPAHLPQPTPVETAEYEPGIALPEEVTERNTPLILKGFVAHWPLVSQAMRDVESVHSYLKLFDRGAVVPIAAGSSAMDGRIFYNDQFSGLNVEQGRAHLGEVLEKIAGATSAGESPLIYLASAEVDEVLPGLHDENSVPFPDDLPRASVWIGTKTRIAAHNDLPRNLACVASGRRRFTLFPPDQTPNLYVGPFELTPAGRPISLIDFAQPDFEKFPRFAQAFEHALYADLEAGDALFIPSMWWHHVESMRGFNILLNYWWRPVPAHLGTPQDVLNHAMMTLRDLPEAERKIWSDLFDHYVWSGKAGQGDHVPEHARGILGPIDSGTADRTRAYIVSRLNR